MSTVVWIYRLRERQQQRTSQVQEILEPCLIDHLIALVDQYAKVQWLVLSPGPRSKRGQCQLLSRDRDSEQAGWDEHEFPYPFESTALTITANCDGSMCLTDMASLFPSEDERRPYHGTLHHHGLPSFYLKTARIVLFGSTCSDRAGNMYGSCERSIVRLTLDQPPQLERVVAWDDRTSFTSSPVVVLDQLYYSDQSIFVGDLFTCDLMGQGLRVILSSHNQVIDLLIAYDDCLWSFDRVQREESDGGCIYHPVTDSWSRIPAFRERQKHSFHAVVADTFMSVINRLSGSVEVFNPVTRDWQLAPHHQLPSPDHCGSGVCISV